MERGPGQTPYLIGLTGNIACGKSLVLARLAELGARAIDADRVVHRLQEPGQPVYRAIREAFGDSVIGPDGSLDRRALAAIVFSDPVALARLEALVHPAVREWIDAEIERSTASVVAIDAIKLFEGGLAARCDENWVVTCTPEQQLARLVAREGYGEEEARRRIDAQQPAALKVARAGVVIDNSGTPEATRAQVDAAWSRLPTWARR